MDLAAIERQRQTLELQVQKLKESLKYWQTWDLEYEGLKEEVQALPDDQPTAQQLSDLSTSYDGTLVNTKEIRDLTGLNATTLRKQRQISDLIDRRIDYVTKNIETISRQFYAAENKLEEFAFASSAASGLNPRFDDEVEQSQDLPFIEIHEELDEDGNVISSELRRPEDETRKIIERLNGVSVNSTSDDSSTASHQAADVANAAGTMDAADVVVPVHEVSPAESSSHTRRPPIRKKSVSFSADTKAAPKPVRSDSQEGRKSVSFATKVAVAPAADPPDTRSVSFSADVEEIPAQDIASKSPEVQKNEADSEKQIDLRASFKPGEKVYELDENAETMNQHVVLPENESPEDAQLRREMLEYHLNEVGSVVAQMELDELEEHSDFTGSEYPEEGDTPYTSETDEEDEHGRSTRREISDAYHEQMKSLQARLIGNIGSGEELDNMDLNPQDVHRLVIRGNRASMSSAASSGSDADRKASKKRVSFAEAVDVAEADALPAKVQRTESQDDSTAGELGESDHQFDGVVADKLVERETSKSSATAPAIDEEDDVIARRQLAAEYYRRRNDMIKQQGGFKASQDDDDEEAELGELMEERDGKLKKVSRFKAARLKG